MRPEVRQKFSEILAGIVSVAFLALSLLLLVFISLSSRAQDIELTPEMYEFSENSVTGVYVCTPRHV
ncbi:MAG: hypothetical protein AAF202_04420, partial [Pseudomonadota bacterium]